MDAFWVSEFTNQTTIHPVGFSVVLILGLAMLVLPRRNALVPLLIVAMFVPMAQRLVVMGFDFSYLRILVVCGALRVSLRREWVSVRLQPLDWLLITGMLAWSVVYSLQWMESWAVINRLGLCVESIGVYVLGRILIREWNDLLSLIKTAAYAAIPVCIFFLVENQTCRNIFSVLGGVPNITEMREDRLRCQGPFSHPIIAGVFWASLVPLFAALAWQGKRLRIAAVSGVVGSLIIVYCCASSTPVLALAAGVVGAAFYPLRGQMRYVVWSFAAILCVLHLIMQAPVWHLIARVSAVGGSTGWHRYHLIDETINHVNEWAILGVKSTAHWGYGLVDVTNQYVLYAVTGGLVTLAIFVWLLIVAYRGVGRALQQVSGDRPKSVLCWAVGVMLFVHCMCFIGVSYFGQANMIWYLSLAIAANVATVLAPQSIQVRRRVRRSRPVASALRTPGSAEIVQTI